MLYKVFIIQWNNPVKGDWSELVKEDLDDFEISRNLDDLKSHSKHTFKKLLKEKSKEYAFKNLITNKEKHSKMDNIKYSKLKMQSYLKSSNISMKEALALFKLRTRMAEFGENFRAGADAVLCPLSLDDLDNQSHMFKCKLIKEEIDFNIDDTKAYENNIKEDTAKIISKILKIRSNLIEQLNN